MTSDRKNDSKSLGFDVFGTPCRCDRARVFRGVDRWEEFWKTLSGQASGERCAVLELAKSTGSSRKTGDAGKARKTSRPMISRSVIVPHGAVRMAELRFLPGFTGDISMSVVLEAGSSMALVIKGIVGTGDEVGIEVTSRQESKESVFVCRGKLGSVTGSSLSIETSGKVGRKAVNAQCSYDLQVLQLGAGGVVECYPHIEVMRDDVVARHGFSSARIPDDAILYSQTRGIEHKEMEELYLGGFFSNLLRHTVVTE